MPWLSADDIGIEFTGYEPKAFESYVMVSAAEYAERCDMDAVSVNHYAKNGIITNAVWTGQAWLFPVVPNDERR